MTQTFTHEAIETEIAALREAAKGTAPETVAAVQRLLDDAWRAVLVGGPRSAGCRYRMGVAKAMIARAA